MQVSRTQRGVGLIDVVVGVSIMVVVFVGIAGVIQLSVKLVGVNKGKVGALALANEQMEFIRSLPYDDVGVQGGVPAGVIAATETINLNNIDYQRRTLIEFVDNPQDGTATSTPVDAVPTDFKIVKIEVRWDLRDESRSIALTSHIVPAGLEDDVPGGTLRITALDALGGVVSGATVDIVNATVTPPINTTRTTDASGVAFLFGAPTSTAAYEITVSRSGYSTDATYTATSSNPNPNPGHLTVAEDTITSATFDIDVLSQKIVGTFTPIQYATWTDSFIDSSKIAESSTTTFVGGAAALAIVTGGQYSPSGTFSSVATTSAYLREWQQFLWSDTVSATTTVTYHLEYDTGSGFSFIPDIDLPGNGTGFTTSPVDLTGLSTSTYHTLRGHAVLQTTNTLFTPSIEDIWLSYEEGPIPLPNIPFTLRGLKAIGSDASSTPIYKYDENHQTNAQGTTTIESLEWDTYTIDVDRDALNLDIAEICPPNPVDVSPGTLVNTDIIFAPQTSHSLLVTVVDTIGSVLEGASVRLFRTGYDQTQSSSGCGQTFYDNLTTASDYEVEVTLTGYQMGTSTVDVTGPTALQVILDTV